MNEPPPRCCCIKDLGVGDDEEVVQRPGAQGTLVVSSCLLRAKDGKRLFVGEVEQADEAIRDRNLLELGAVDLEKGMRVSGSRVFVLVGARGDVRMHDGFRVLGAQRFSGWLSRVLHLLRRV